MAARATAIIPTFGEASFARWAIASVQQQTVRDLEICVVCDGSPDSTVALFERMREKDTRIRVVRFPKSPRTGEPHRDAVIRQTTGRVVCYCSHDDLWLPNHVETVERSLATAAFTHTIHTIVNTPEQARSTGGLLGGAFWVDLLDQRILRSMREGVNFLGLTFGAHTREAYLALEEGWVTTPRADLPTDLYMWGKLLAAHGDRCRTAPEITALNFRRIDRLGWTEQERDRELEDFLSKLRDPAFLRRVERTARALRPWAYPFLGRMRRLRRRLYKLPILGRRSAAAPR